MKTSRHDRIGYLCVGGPLDGQKLHPHGRSQDKRPNVNGVRIRVRSLSSEIRMRTEGGRYGHYMLRQRVIKKRLELSPLNQLPFELENELYWLWEYYDADRD